MVFQLAVLSLEIRDDIHKANTYLYQSEEGSVKRALEKSKWLFDKYPEENFILLWNDEHFYYKIHSLSELK